MVKRTRKSTTVPLNWKEVWFTNCPMVSANNVDQELGWCREEFKKIGVDTPTSAMHPRITGTPTTFITSII